MNKNLLFTLFVGISREHEEKTLCSVLEKYFMNFPSFIFNVGYHQSDEMKIQNIGESNKSSKPVIDVQVAKELIVCNYNFLYT